MKTVFRIKLEALNIYQIINTYYSGDFDNYPSDEDIKNFMEGYKLEFKTRCQCQVVKLYMLEN